MKNLIFLPRPFEEESPLSLIKRTANRHGFRSTAAFISANLKHYNFRNESPLLIDSKLPQYLISEAGDYAPNIQDVFYSKIKQPDRRILIRIGRNLIPQHFLRVKGNGFCDACFEEGREHQIKDLKTSAFCPYHIKQYLFNCPHCNKEIHWWRSLHGACDYCGTVLKCPSCQPDCANFEASILGMLRHEEQTKLDMVFQIIRRLGYRPELPLFSVSERRMVCNASLAIVNHDTSEIYNYLKALQKQYPEASKRWIIARLNKITDDAVAQAIIRFGRTPPQPSSEVRKLETPPLPLSYPQIKQELKLNTKINRRLRIELELSQHLGRIYFTHLDAENIAATLESLAHTHNGDLPLPTSEMLTGKQVKDALRVTSFTLRTCIQQEILSFYPGSWRKQLFHPLEIQAFQKKFQSLNSIAKSLNWNLHHTAKLASHLKITPAFNQNHTPGQWILHKKDADRLLHQAIHQRSQPQLQPLVLPSYALDKNPAETYITLSTAATMLKVMPYDVHCAILYGLIKGACRQGAKMLIPQKEVERFSRNYISLNEAAKKLNIASANIVDVLWSFGIHPALQWNAALFGKRHTTFFNRSSVAKYANCELGEHAAGTFNFYSTTAAARKLGISNHTLTALALNNLITCLRGRSSNYYRLEDIKIFQNNYIMLSSILQKHHLQVAQASPAAHILQNLGLTPLEIKTDRETIFLYDRSNYYARLSEPDSALATALANFSSVIKNHHSRRNKSEPNDNYVSIASAAAIHGMTARDYSRALVRPNNIPLKCFHKTLYIRESDRIKCDKIIENHLTIDSCDKFLGYIFTRSLIKSKVLAPSLIFPGRKKCLRLIARADIRQLIKALVNYACFPLSPGAGRRACQSGKTNSVRITGSG